MVIVLDRIDFYNNNIVIDDEPIDIKPDFVEIDFRVKIGKGWLQGTLRDVPYKEYIELSHAALIDEIKKHLE